MKILLKIVFILLTSECFASETTVQEYVNNRIEYAASFQAYLHSVFVGHKGVQAGKPYSQREFCPPPKLEHQLNFTAFVDEFIAITPAISDLTLGEVFMIALREKYPCL